MSIVQLTAEQADNMSRYLHSLKGHIEMCPDVSESYGERAEELVEAAERAVEPFDEILQLDYPLVDEEDLKRALPLLEETYHVFESHCYNNCPPDERNARDDALRAFIDEMKSVSHEAVLER
ncbi:MAG: hypothetical protein VX730_06705 [Pseudomonadota bacterium]|nr:hypothetical protein [Pseudomonadota bacterium]